MKQVWFFGVVFFFSRMKAQRMAKVKDTSSTESSILTLNALVTIESEVDPGEFTEEIIGTAFI